MAAAKRAPETAGKRGASSPRAPATAAAAGDGAGFLSSKEAAQLLRIKTQTLYAYVSRGWIHSIGRDKRRGYLYLRDDVERLRARGHARAEGGPYKAGSPRWSEPIVQTTITSITPAGPIYRGRSAIELAAQGHSFESVAELLWSGVWHDDQRPWQNAPPPPAMDKLGKAIEVNLAKLDTVRMFALYVMALAARSIGGDDLRDGNTVDSARTLLTGLPRCMSNLATASAPVKVAGTASTALAPQILVSARAPASEAAVAALNAALVVLADHELTPQTFAARLAASSGASLYFCILSALAAHSGSRIRRACDRVEDLLLDQPRGGAGNARLAELGRALAVVPGFTHPLYPNGDPRAEYLLDLARSIDSPAPGPIHVAAILDTATRQLGTRPSVEAALVALCHGLRLPYRSAGAILTISRCAGWVAHVIEQRLAGMMLRPRARYLAASARTAEA